MSEKLIRIKKNGEWNRVSAKSFKHDKASDILLIPFYRNDLSAYIVLESSEFLEFDRAEVSCSIEFLNVDYEDQEISDRVIGKPTHTVYTDIISLVNYLHSVTRFYYANTLMEHMYEDNFLPYSATSICGALSVKLFKGKAVIFSMDYRARDKISDTGTFFIDEDHRCRKKLEDLYRIPTEMIDNTDNNYFMMSGKIRYAKKIKDADNVVGMILPQSGIILFMSPREHKKLKVIDRVICRFMVADTLGESDPIQVLRHQDDYDSYMHAHGETYFLNSSIELFIFAQFIALINTTIFSNFIYNSDPECPTFDCIVSLIVKSSIDNSEVCFRLTSGTEITLSEILEYIIKKLNR